MATNVTTLPPLPSSIADPRDAGVARPHALTTRFVDFWLLGGASLLVWFVMFAVQGFRGAWAIDQHFKNLTFTTASLSLLVNYPHFLISYKLAYTRGREFITTHWWQLIAVPVLLVVTFAWAYARYNTPVSQLPLVSMLSHDISGFGNNARVLSGTAPGRSALRDRLQRDALHRRVALHEAGVRLHDGVRVKLPTSYPMSLRQRNDRIPSTRSSAHLSG